MFKHWKKVLSCVLGLGILFGAATGALVRNSDTVAAGGGGGGGATWDTSGARYKSVGSWAYVWYDDKDYVPGNNTAPKQGKYLKGGKVTDEMLQFWIDKFTALIGKGQNKTVTFLPRDSYANPEEYDNAWEAFRSAYKEACENALKRDPATKNNTKIGARVVGVALTWAHPGDEEKTYDKRWILSTGATQAPPPSNSKYPAFSYYSLFSDKDTDVGKNAPTDDELKPTAQFPWSDYVDQSKYNDAKENETWQEYVYRIGSVDNPFEAGHEGYIYVVAVTDSQPEPPGNGYLQVEKAVPDGYTPTGAEYTVYSGSGATGDVLGTFKIKSNGESNVLEIPLEGKESRKVYVKETKKPAQTENGFEWQMDESVYTATVKRDHTEKKPLVVNSTNTVQEFGYLRVRKAVPSGYQPTGAEYSIYKTEAEARSGTNALGKVTIASNGLSDAFRVDVPTGESRTVYVKETKLPAQTGDFDWLPDEKIYPASVSKENTTSNYVRVDSVDTVQEYGYIKIKKTSENNFTIDDKNVLYTTADCVFRVTLSGKATDGSLFDAEFQTASDGWTDTIRVPVGTYTVTETAAPDGHLLDSEPIKNIVITKANTQSNPRRVGGEGTGQLTNNQASDPFSIEVEKRLID